MNFFLVTIINNLEGHSNEFEAYIDPENRFSIKDKFSMVNLFEKKTKLKVINLKKLKKKR